jgi:hypothetical protein
MKTVLIALKGLVLLVLFFAACAVFIRIKFRQFIIPFFVKRTASR